MYICNMKVILQVSWRLDKLHFFIATGTVIHAFSLSSSSFVEEEHQTWYFLTITAHLLLMLQILHNCLTLNSKHNHDFFKALSNMLYTKKDKGCTASEHGSTPLLLLAAVGISAMLCRFLRCLNQTGDKWSHLFDVGDWLNK